MSAISETFMANRSETMTVIDQQFAGLFLPAYDILNSRTTRLVPAPAHTGKNMAARKPEADIAVSLYHSYRVTL
jgi:hypothetical protein